MCRCSCTTAAWGCSEGPNCLAACNLAAGGRGEGRELTARDREICARVAPVIKAKGLMFVGLDVIGDYLTEINVTSPTCIRELDAAFGIDIAGMLLDAVERRLSQG